MSFETRKFNVEFPSGIGSSGISVMLVGASRSGKTTFLKHMLKQFNKHITVMFSMNRHADIYKDLGDKIMISDQFHSELIRDAHQINSLCDNKFPFLFISDDYVDTKIKNDPEITRCMTLYRNAAISSIWSFQGRTLMSAVGRNNANYIAIFKQQTPLEFENVIKEFLSMWLPTGMTMREMVDFCKEATMDHQFFFIDNIEGKCYLSKLSKEQAGA
jgi:hypothetical protein